jgi:hypothetical protein
MGMEIPKPADLEEQVFNIPGEAGFDTAALEIYRFQYANNFLYRDYCDAIRKGPAKVKLPRDIPFLPVSFFKTHRIESTAFDPELIFKSSGTTGSQNSCHYVKSAALYKRSFRSCFNDFFGDPRQYCILGLLPSYLERGGSSLVYMVDQLVKESGHENSGFYLNEFEKLNELLSELERKQQKTILFGVTFALLDFSNQYPQDLKYTMVTETGGMKGRRDEMSREELYTELRSKLNADTIYSEYGMTELLSQAYAVNGRFRPSRQMKICLRDETDPLALKLPGEEKVSGAINVIDLANLYSCSFIATDDQGNLYPDGSFEVLGRLDNSDIRGCSQLVL